MMRPLLFLLLLCGVTASLIAADPSEQFLTAYQTFQEGEKAERGGNTSDATKKYRFAESLLLEISKNDPSWQKAVVEYRLKKTREGLDRMQAAPSSKVNSDEPIQSAGSSQSEVGGTENTSSSGGPSITITPPGASPSRAPKASPESTGELRRLRRQIDDLKGQLTETQDALKSQKNRAKDLENAEWVTMRSKLENDLDVANRTISDLKRDLKARSSWEKDLKDLQKKLDAAVADKIATEEQYSEREKKSAEATAVLTKQLGEAQQKLVEGADARKKYEQLGGDVEKGKEALEQLKIKLEHSEMIAKEGSAKNAELQKQLSQATEKLADAQKQADELAPLREKLKGMEASSVREKNETRLANEKLLVLEQTSQKLKKEFESREAMLRADFQALEEDRQNITAKAAVLSELAKDAGKVSGLESEAQSLKKTIAQLQDHIATADKELTKVRAEAETSAKTAKASAEKLATITSALEADRTTLEEERQRLTAKLDQASKTIAELGKQAAAVAPLSKEMEQLKAQLAENAKALELSKSQLATAADASKAERAEGQRRAEVSKGLKEMLEQQNASLQEQLKSTLGKMSTLVDHGTDTSGFQDQVKKLQQQLDLNTKNYAESQRQLTEVAKARPEQEKALQEKEKALSEAKGDAEKLRLDLLTANKKVSELEQQGTQGKDRLRQLEEKLAELSKNAPEKEKTVAAAQQEVEKLRAELNASKEKITTLQGKESKNSDHLKELQDQLSGKESELARLKRRKGKSSGDEKTVEENVILREIVLREVKEEAKRSQARRLMEEELKRLNIQSQSLTDQITVLSSPVVRLTPQERALFKEGQLVVSEESEEKLQASVSAPIAAEPAAEKTEKTTNQAVKSSAEAPSSTNIPSSDIAWQGKFKECLARAKEEFDRQDYLQAESTFKEALKLAPDDYFALSNLGVVEFQLGKMKEAEESLSKAIEHSSESSFALTTLGIVHYRQERTGDAEKVLRKAVSVNPQDFTAHNYLGIVLAASGKGKAGESEIMKAIEINPQYADAHFNLAVIYATSKPAAKMLAKKHYAKALSLGAPPDPSLEKLIQ